MIAIRAAQHFFSSVPAEQSPQKKRGYQTLARTPGLVPDVVRQIEDRCLFGGGESSPAKYQYYPLPNQLYAFSHTVALNELDEFGRKGRYLAHTLVVDENTFHQLEDCPVDILQQFPFSTRLEEVFRQVKTGTMDLPPVAVQVNPRWRQLAEEARSEWNGDLLKRLGRLAWQVQRLAEGRTSTAAYGQPEQLFPLLALLFGLARPHERHLLSFDTYAQGCDWAPHIFFWLQGFAPGERGRLAQWVDVSAHQVGDFLKSPDTTPYGQWMEAEGVAQSQVSGSMDQIWAEKLEESLLKGQGAAHTGGLIPEEFLVQFAQVNVQELSQAWVKQLPAGLSPELLSRFRAAVTAAPAPYIRILHQGARPEDIAAFLFVQLYGLQAVPSRSDRGHLEKFIQASKNRTLASLPALWSKNEKEWASLLNGMDRNDYRYAISRLAAWPEPPVPIWKGIVQLHVDEWMQAAAGSLPVKEWKNALNQLADINDASVNQLARYLPSLAPEAQQEISRWLEKYDGSAFQLRAAFPEQPKKKFLGLF